MVKPLTGFLHSLLSVSSWGDFPSLLRHPLVGVGRVVSLLRINAMLLSQRDVLVGRRSDVAVSPSWLMSVAFWHQLWQRMPPASYHASVALVGIYYFIGGLTRAQPFIISQVIGLHCLGTLCSTLGPAFTR